MDTDSHTDDLPARPLWAGTTLQEVQEAAWAAGFFYPVDLGSAVSARSAATSAPMPAATAYCAMA